MSIAFTSNYTGLISCTENFEYSECVRCVKKKPLNRLSKNSWQHFSLFFSFISSPDIFPFKEESKESKYS